MNACIDDVRVHNDHAIRCSIVCRPVNVVDYIKAVSSVIGSSHILAVFEERDSIKIFLNDKRFVDTLMKSCLHVMGYHVKVDYVSPPGTRIVLTDIDPIISNYDVMRLLSVYGTVVSPVIRPPVSDDTQLCHIGYGVRYVYMNLTNDHMPEKIEFKYGEHMCSFKIHVETPDILMLANIKVDPHDDTALEYENSISPIPCQSVSSPPILVNVQSVNSNEEELSTPKLLTSNANNRNQESSEMKRECRPATRHKHMRMAKTVTATSNAARKIKRNMNHKWGRYRKCKADSLSRIKKTFCNPSKSSRSRSFTRPDNSTLLLQKKEEIDIADEVLGHEQLLEFLNDVRYHHAPLEVAKKYLGDDCDLINKLVEQLKSFRKQQTEVTLKNRVFRLVKSLKDSLNNSSQSVSPDMLD